MADTDTQTPWLTVEELNANGGALAAKMGILFTEANQDRGDQYAQTLSTLQDLDYNKALSDFARQQLAPEVDHLLGLREEAVSADVEQEILVVHRPADAADIGRVALQHGHPAAGLGEKVGRRQTRRARAHDEDVGVCAHALSHPRSARWDRRGAMQAARQ